MKRVNYFLLLIICLTAISAAVMQSCKTKSTQTGTQTSASFQFKEKLSDYNFFRNRLKDLDPNPGVVHYEISTTLFSDYAVKDRYVVLPKGTVAKYTAEGPLDFPDSTFIIKNFAYTNTAHQKIIIETRILFKSPVDKTWKVMAYLWNKEQTDAVKHITGAQLPITLLDDEGNKISTNYLVPNTNDCKRCHIKNDIIAPIGPKARNLNLILPGQTENQLAQWTANGLLTGTPALDAVQQLPNWKDKAHFSLDQRARAYLDVNCAHCHTKGGDATNTGLFLEYEQTGRDHIGIMKEPVSAGNGAGGLNYDIIPGDAAHSILAYRMNSSTPGTAMPEMARTIIHQEGVRLIKEWINQMPPEKK